MSALRRLLNRSGLLLGARRSVAMCDVPCPPPSQQQGAQSCLPPPPPICQDAKMRPKPNMRNLHWAQTKSIIFQALSASAISGALVYFLLGQRRRAAYKYFNENTDFEEWADDMAKKGLFQAVPRAS